MHRTDQEITDEADLGEEGVRVSSTEPVERPMKVVDRKRKKVQVTREDTEDEGEAATSEGVASKGEACSEGAHQEVAGEWG